MAFESQREQWWTGAVEEPRHRLADRAVQCGGNRGVRWTGARGPLARIAVFGTFRQLRSCGTRRPPPMSVRGLSGVGLTSAPHRTSAFKLPMPPPLAHLECLLPLRVPSSHMPPTPTSSPVSLLKKGTYLMKSDTKVKMFNQGTQKNNHGTFM